MSRQKQMAKNAIILILGKVCTQFMSFLLLPLYTSYLSKSEYGIVDLVATYVALLFPIVFLQIDQAVFRFLVDIRDKEDGKNSVISTSILFTIVLSIIASVIFLCFQGLISVEYKWYALFNVLSIGLSNLMLQVARGNGDNVGYAISSFISALVQIGLSIVFLVLLKFGVSSILSANIIANIVVFFLLFFREKAYKYLDVNSFSKPTLMEILKYSLPFVPNTLSWWMIQASDRFIVAYFLGVSANGILSVGHKFPSLFFGLFALFNLSWTESATLNIGSNDKDTFFSETITNIFKLFISTAILITGCMPIAFSILINENFNEAYNLIPIFMAASMCNVMIGMYSVIYIALKKTKEIAKTSIFSGVINVVVCIALIKFIGIYAAAVAAVISMASMMVYRFVDLRNYVKVKIPVGLVVSLISIFAVICAIYYSGNLVIQITGFVVTLVALTVINKNLVLSLLSQVKLKAFRRE